MPKYNDFDLDLQQGTTKNPTPTCSAANCGVTKFSCPMLKLTYEGKYPPTCAL